MDKQAAENMTKLYHQPVMLKESIDGLDIQPEAIYVDATFGGGGHTKEIIKRLTTGKVFAFDQDENAHVNAIQDQKIILIQQNFRYLKNHLSYHKINAIHGLIADLGVSWHQFDNADRGFSTRFENAELDMRMNQSQKTTAKSILNTYSEKQLNEIFRFYGELNNTSKLAREIVIKRKEKEISTVKELKEAIALFADKRKENQYYAKVFQALRIEVNEELIALKELLTQCEQLIVKGGRLVIISYHSLEDRIVKNFIKKGKFEGELEKDVFGNSITSFKMVENNVIVPSEAEIRNNTRARSAKLRIAEKI